MRTICQTPHLRSPYSKKEIKVFCYKCEEYGYLGYGWTKNSYGTQYQTNYIRHYSSEKYHKMMEEYRSHKIKSRPNGQKRCYVPLVDFYPTANREYYTACCYNPNLIQGYNAKHKLSKILQPQVSIIIKIVFDYPLVFECNRIGDCIDYLTPAIQYSFSLIVLLVPIGRYHLQDSESQLYEAIHQVHLLKRKQVFLSPHTGTQPSEPVSPFLTPIASPKDVL